MVLKQALGVRRLCRTTRRVSLIALGRDAARTVHALLDDLDSTLLTARGVAATRMGEVTIGCVRSLCPPCRGGWTPAWAWPRCLP